MSAEAPAARPQGRGNPLPMLIILGIIVTFVVMLFSGPDPFTLFLVDPLLNLLVLINIVTLGNFGLAIIVFTILLRVATIPFTIRQLESTKALQAMQPLQAEIQKKYKDPKRRQEELMKLYREHKINPLGCLVPLLIQFVVFACLYRALVHTSGGSPESLIGLSHRLYPIDLLQNQIPLNQHFLWMNMGKPDPTLLTPILVGISTYVQQRLSITPTNNPQQQQQQQMMTWMVPLMLMFITLNLPSGVGVYWVVSNIFSLFASYYVYGKRVLSWKQLLPVPLDAPAPAASAEKKKRPDGQAPELEGEALSEASANEGEPEAAPREARSDYGKRRGKRKKRR